MDNRKFRLLFITQDDPFYVRLFFEEFFKGYPDSSGIAAVVIAEPMGKKSLYQLARQMYAFYGPFDFVRVGLRFAAYKVMERMPDTFHRNGTGASISEMCNRSGIPVIYENQVNSIAFQSKVRVLAPDLIVSVAAPVIFKQGLIRIPAYGCINIHNGKLPRYRGMLPNFWQMYNDEAAVGITVHEINAGIDDGRIILQRDVAIEPDETLDSLIKRTKRIGAHCMIDAIEMVRSGKVTYTENPSSEGTYFSFPTRADVKEFKRRGKRII